MCGGGVRGAGRGSIRVCPWLAAVDVGLCGGSQITSTVRVFGVLPERQDFGNYLTLLHPDLFYTYLPLHILCVYSSWVKLGIARLQGENL